MGRSSGSEVVPELTEPERAVLRVLGRDGPQKSANAICGRTPHRRHEVLTALYGLMEDGLVQYTAPGIYELGDAGSAFARPKPSGLQVSYRKAVQAATTAVFADRLSSAPRSALEIAERCMREALSDRQRALLDERTDAPDARAG